MANKKKRANVAQKQEEKEASIQEALDKTKTEMAQNREQYENLFKPSTDVKKNSFPELKPTLMTKAERKLARMNAQNND